MSVTTDHVDALKAMIQAQTRAMVFTQRPQDPKPTDFPYVVLSVAPGLLGSDRLAQRPHRAEIEFTTTCVGLTVESALIIGDRVQQACALQRPSIGGRSCSLIRQTAATFVDPQDTSLADRTVTTVIDRWSFISRTAL